jgi:hypothetical protein
MAIRRGNGGILMHISKNEISPFIVLAKNCTQTLSPGAASERSKHAEIKVGSANKAKKLN